MILTKYSVILCVLARVDAGENSPIEAMQGNTLSTTKMTFKSSSNSSNSSSNWSAPSHESRQTQTPHLLPFDDFDPSSFVT